MPPRMVGLLIGLALGVLLGYNQIYARYKGQVRLKETQTAQARADEEARRSAAQILTQLEQYRDQLPLEPDPSWLVREAVAASQKAGFELTSIVQDSPRVEKQFTRLSVNLQFPATYHELGTLLDHLERSPRFLRVERLNVSSPKPHEERAAVELTLSTLHVPPLVDSGKAARDN